MKEQKKLNKLHRLLMSFGILMLAIIPLIGANKPKVHVAGYENDKKICYWINGVKNSLPAMPNTINSLSVYKGKVYAAGYILEVNEQENTKRWTPSYWLNGVKKDLPLKESTKELITVGLVENIIIFNDKVYAFGHTGSFLPEAGGHMKPALWVNGKERDLSDISDYLTISDSDIDEIAKQIVIFNDKLYISVTRTDVFGISSAAYFAYGKKMELSETNAVTSDITVNKGKIYIAGRYKKNGYNQACYWVDGRRVDLAGGVASRATSIVLSGGKIYVSGYYYDKINKACYWVDGVKKDLIDGAVPEVVDDSVKLPIVVFQGKVYIAGCYYDKDKNAKACYWLDGVRVDLPGGTKAVAIEVN